MIINWKELIASCLKSDQAAQKVLYDHFKGKMFGLCLRYVSDRQAAEDILLQGFFKVFRDLPQFNPDNSLEGWIRKIMINTALMHLRKNKRLVSADLTIEKLPFDLEDQEQIISGIAVGHIIEQIQKLPDGYRTIFNLYAIEGYSHREIAQQLDIAESTSRSQYLRAKAALKIVLQNQKVL